MAPQDEIEIELDLPAAEAGAQELTGADQRGQATRNSFDPFADGAGESRPD